MDTRHTSNSSPIGGGREGALTLYLHRNRIHPQTCDGTLYDEQGNRLCDTAEATPFMLPPGEYPLGRIADHFSRTNGVYALRDATILVGDAVIPEGYNERLRVPGVVIRTADAYDRLRRRINKARERGKHVMLVITDSPKS